MSVYVWEAIFMLLVLKLPVIYLAAVVLWAVRAQPETSGAGADESDVRPPLTPCGWDDWKGGRRVRRIGWRPNRPSGRGARARLT